MAKAVTGIDIGSGHLKMAVCNGANVSQVAIEEMPDNLVKDGRITSFETMSDLLRAAVRKNRIAVKDCALVLHASDVFTRRMSLPAMTVDELKLNLPFEFKDYIADGKDKYRFDYSVLGMTRDDAGAPEEMDILACAAPIETIDAYGSMLRRAGLRLKAAAPDIMAYANIISQYAANGRIGRAAEPVPAMPVDPAVPGLASADGAPERVSAAERDYCFLDIGTDSTRVYLFPRGKYEVTRLIEFGVSSLIAAVADSFGIDYGLARTYVASDYEGAQLVQPCRDLYERLGMEVARIVSFFNFNYPDSHLESVYYCGSGSGIAPLLDALREHLAINLLDIGAVMPGSAVSPDILRLCPAAVGIALR